MPYLFEKLIDKIQRLDWGNPANKRAESKLKKLKYWIDFLLRFVAKLMQVLGLANFLGFMAGFRTRGFQIMRNLSETVLQVRLSKYDESLQQRNMSFEYVNILVVWTAIGRSLASLLPFLDFSRVQRLLQGATMQSTQTFAFASTQDENASSNEKTGMLCMVCGTTQICMPYRAVPCKCVYCYYCIQSKMQEAEGEDSKGK